MTFNDSNIALYADYIEKAVIKIVKLTKQNYKFIVFKHTLNIGSKQSRIVETKLTGYSDSERILGLCCVIYPEILHTVA